VGSAHFTATVSTAGLYEICRLFGKQEPSAHISRASSNVCASAVTSSIN